MTYRYQLWSIGVGHQKRREISPFFLRTMDPNRMKHQVEVYEEAAHDSLLLPPLVQLTLNSLFI